jgi:integrase/recombinase XerD
MSAEMALLPPPLSAPSLWSASTESTLARFVPQEPAARQRFAEFFSVHIRNKNTRAAYLTATRSFADWCAGQGIASLRDVQPMHVAAYVERLGEKTSKPTAKQHLAALRMLFDWLVTGQVLPLNPAHAVRGPRYSVRQGKTPVLTAEELRHLLDSIETDNLIGLRDRAFLGLLSYTFARVSAAVGMKVEDFYIQGRKSWVRLGEKGGKVNELPVHPNLDSYLVEYLEAAGLTGSSKSPLFRAAPGKTRQLGVKALSRHDAYQMIRRRARATGIRSKIGCHSFRATGITTYLKNEGRLEIAQQMAGHASARTTSLYDRRGDEVALDEILRIRY